MNALLHTEFICVFLCHPTLGLTQFASLSVSLYSPVVVDFFSRVTVFLVHQEEIGKVDASGNLDNPEGGLDALMQATVCKVGSENCLSLCSKCK